MTEKNAALGSPAARAHSAGRYTIRQHVVSSIVTEGSLSRHLVTDALS